MKIVINDKAVEIANNISLAVCLKQLGYQQQTFAVALNQTFIAQEEYETMLIKENDRIDIIIPMPGG